ncbi:hypothetical protein [Paracoccus xiamenensis]|uniref:hypothetical protein n=1 Tax=Paracoccus xiamenensis TaxID=2714901 RepID=UPI00140A0ADE|nr:hypothetical protein [Paracoccus xiamenensis]NHF74001.1 hypothetical protein [Paracoccus xiamenensis]
MVPIVAGVVASQSERQLRAMVQSIIEPSWIEYVFEPLTDADHRRAAALLDMLVDLLVESGIGVKSLPILADDPADWSRKRRLRAPINESYFELSVNPDGGINLLISFEDKSFHEHGLSVEAVIILIHCFTSLRLASPFPQQWNAHPDC